MIRTEEIQELIGLLTPDQWFGIVTRDEEGLLPPCCANVSALRDRLTDILTTQSDSVLVAAGQQFVAEGDDDHLLVDEPHWAPLLAFRARLYELLDADNEGWREIDLAAKDRRIDEWMLKINLAGTSEAPDVTPTPYQKWEGAFAIAVTTVTMIRPDDEAWLLEHRGACEALRKAGAPHRIIAGVYQYGIEAWQEAHRGGG